MYSLLVTQFSLLFTKQLSFWIFQKVTLSKWKQDVFQHLFDGSALVQKYAIENGEVYYQCRFIRSKSFVQNIKNNAISRHEFATNALQDNNMNNKRKLGFLLLTLSSSSILHLYDLCSRKRGTNPLLDYLGDLMKDIMEIISACNNSFRDNRSIIIFKRKPTCVL